MAEKKEKEEKKDTAEKKEKAVKKETSAQKINTAKKGTSAKKEASAKKEKTEKKEKARKKDKSDLNEKAVKIIDNYVGYAMVAGFVPIPFADIIAVTAMQVAMVNELAKLYEVEFDKKQTDIAIAALVNTTLGAAVGRIGASLLKGIPGIGTLLGIGSQAILAGATTYAIGHVIKDHFSNNGDLNNFNVSEVAQRFKDFFERGKKVAGQKEKKMNDDDIIATIDKLNKLKESGAISEEEFNKSKKDLLAKLGKGGK